MGVDKTTHLMYGIRLNEEQSKVASRNWSEEDLNMINYIEGDPEVDGWTLIYDGMCGENHYFGKVLEQTDRDDYTSYRELDISILQCVSTLFKERFGHCFGNQVELGDSEPLLMLVNHFS